MNSATSRQLPDSKADSELTLTIRVLHGAKRGVVFRELVTPVSIGRENGNSIQLDKDEQISRFHAKIQKSDGRLRLIDLGSTNGTKVNGNKCSERTLRFGDTISIGKDTILLVGSKSEVQEWLSENQDSGNSDSADQSKSDREPSTGLVPNNPASLVPAESDLPRNLSTGQAAELQVLLKQFHQGLQQSIESAESDKTRQSVNIKLHAWQTLLATQSRLSELICSPEGLKDNVEEK
ncbi:MAG: FHA domain-containing protein [Planctomycetota bacterium]